MQRLPSKLPVELSSRNEVKKIAKRGDCTAFLQHHLGNIIMRVLAQLGFKRLKYPSIGSKETALKFIAISLKMSNPNQDERYRAKYRARMELFIKHCTYAQEIKEQFKRKEALMPKGQWADWEEENLLKVCEEFSEFIHKVNNSEKVAYFSQFIR